MTESADRKFRQEVMTGNADVPGQAEVDIKIVDCHLDYAPDI